MKKRAPELFFIASLSLCLLFTLTPHIPIAVMIFIFGGLISMLWREALLIRHWAQSKRSMRRIAACILYPIVFLAVLYQGIIFMCICHGPLIYGKY